MYIPHGLLIFLSALYALAPATESDELRYHLSAPAAWMQAKSLFYISWQAFSNFPMLVEMLFMAAMGFKSELTGAAHLIHVIFYATSIALVSTCTRKIIAIISPGFPHRRLAAATTSFAFASIPFAFILAGWAFVDFAMTAYWLGFCLFSLNMLRSPTASSRMRQQLILCGFMIAGAVGTKYSMIPQIGLACILWGVLHAISGRKISCTIRSLFIIAVIAAIMSSIWFIKNWHYTGNPVYPLAWNLFGGGEWSAAHADFYLAKAREKGWYAPDSWGALAQPLEFLVSPITTALFAERFEGHFLGPIAFIALCFALFGFARPSSRKRRLEIIYLYGLTAIAWLCWFKIYQSNRMLLPALGLLLPLGAAGVAHLWPALQQRARIAVAAMLCLSLFFNLVLGLTTFAMPLKKGPDRVDAILTGLGLASKELYLARRINYYRAAQWLNEHAGPNEKVLLIGEHRTLYFKTQTIASDWFDTPQPLPWIRATRNNDEMLDQLRAAGVRYVLLNAGELRGYYREYWLGLDPPMLMAKIPPRMTLEEYRRIAFEPLEHNGRMLVTNDQLSQSLWNNPRIKQVYEDPLNNVRIYDIS